MHDMSVGKEMLSQSKFYMGYSRWSDELRRYETWDEAVSRVMSMHRKKYEDKLTPELEELITFAAEAYRDKLTLGAQRALQFGGEQIFKHESRNYNCCVSHCDRAAFFQETMYLLLSGCGVGFSVQHHHIAKLPKLKHRYTKKSKVFTVPDSIEGWADAFGVLISSYFVGGGTFPDYEGCQVRFDLSEIRPKGAEISGGFKAPGPDGLRDALNKCEDLLEAVVHSEKDCVTIPTITAYDFVMHMGDAVLSGGVRRSATICIFSKDDEDMLNAKTGDWFIKNPQRGRSNNSVILLRDDLKREEWAHIMESVRQVGEPGFVFTDNLEHLFNPCVTKDTMVMTSEGRLPVEKLIGKKFKAVVNGEEYDSVSEGFWKTGEKQVLRLETKNGFFVNATNNHKILCSIEGEEVWKELGELIVGDEVVLNKTKDYSWGESSTAEHEKGWVLGNLVGDGGITDNSAYLRYWGEEGQDLKHFAIKALTSNFKTYKDFTGSDFEGIITFESSELKPFAETFGVVQGNKTPNNLLEQQSSTFIEGYLQGFFDADGSVQGNLQKGVSVRLTQNSLATLEQVQRLLLSIGISSTVYKERRPEGWYDLPDGTGEGNKKFFCKAVHDLVISKDNIKVFSERVGFKGEVKMGKLTTLLGSYKRRLNTDKFTSPVKSITLLGTEEVYDVTITDVHRFDANGIIVHNCVEIGMLPYDFINEESGFQFCNLTEINGGKCVNKKELMRAAKAGAILGTLQAGYTNFTYVSQATRNITEREALTGVSITGWMNNPDVLFDETNMTEAAEIVKQYNKIVAKLIGINQAARTTCVKPSGNASVLLGTASGIHGEHSPRYFRNVQMNEQDDVLKLIRERNPHMVDKSVWSNTGTDYVVSFPVVSKEGSIYKKDLLGVRQLEFVKKAQEFWVNTGTNLDLCVDKTLRHNVSNTITVDDWDEVEQYIFDNCKHFAGISLLSAYGDKGYAQAPFTEVLTASEIMETYGDASMFASGLIIDALKAFNNDLWAACDTVTGVGANLDPDNSEHLLKRDWVRRAKKFAKNYFAVGDNDCIRHMTDCLKDCYNLHKWKTAERCITPIDFSKEMGEKVFVDVSGMGAQGCSGGACEISF